MEKKDDINYQKLWEQVSEYAKKGGRMVARPLLLLYYVLKSPDTRKTDKILIVTAFSYLILPIDVIPSKKFPIMGWLDEGVAIWTVYNGVKKYRTPHIEQQVDRLLDKWFPVTEYKIFPNTNV